jgi:hypothetical protein
LRQRHAEPGSTSMNEAAWEDDIAASNNHTHQSL